MGDVGLGRSGGHDFHRLSESFPGGTPRRGAADRPLCVLVVDDYADCAIELPGLDGYELAERIRAREWGRDALLIAATGRCRDAEKRRAQEAGFDHHRLEPLDPAELRKLLAAFAAR